MNQKNIMTPEEATTVLSMAKYWNEVSKREDTRPLRDELSMIFQKFGVRILWILEAYAASMMASKETQPTKGETT